MTIVVKSINDAPQALNVDSLVSEGELSTIVELGAVDVDNNDPSDIYTYAPSFSDTLFTKISAWPAFGDLYQTAGDGIKTELIADTLGQLEATGSDWASEIIRFSSQWSNCGGECMSWANPVCDRFEPMTSSSVSDPQFSEPIMQWLEDGQAECFDGGE